MSAGGSASIKIIVMGVGGVGKSAITNRYVIGRWVEKYDPTVEESYQTIVDIDGRALQVEILDTAGQDEYSPLRETFMHTGDGFILVFDITDDQTFEELRSIREQILRVHSDKKVPMVLVGNKSDLAAQKKAVSQAEAENFANECGGVYIEVSAKKNIKIRGAAGPFETLVRLVMAKQPAKGGGSNTASIFGGGVDHSIVEGGSSSENKKKSGKDSPSGKSPKKKKKSSSSSFSCMIL